MTLNVVVRSGGLDLAKGPRIISLVLETFNCMSLLSVQSSQFLKKFNTSDLGDLVAGLQTRWSH